MFATLNPQLLSTEITEDSMLTSTMTPDVAPVAEFADLLRLRIDTAEGPPVGFGQALPPGGSELPLQALPVELDAPASSELNVIPQGVPLNADPLSNLAQAEPSLAKLAPGQAQPASLTPEADPSITLTAAPAADPLPSIATSRDVSSAPQSRPLPLVQPQPVMPAEVQQTVSTLAGKPDPASVALREPVLPVQPQPAAPTDVDKNMPIAELPRRTEAMPMPVAGVEEISEVFKPRPTVIPTVQVLGAQPNPQQAIVMPATPTTVATDAGFAAAVQQAGDLIPVPVRDSAWAEQVGERVLLMAGKQMTSAEIRLTPAELGPLRVQVSVDDGAANVTFQAQHAVTREAIEQALPRLRELLAESGLSLGQASVGDQGVAEGKRDERSNPADLAAGEVIDSDEAGEAAEPRRVVASDSLVDTFA